MLNFGDSEVAQQVEVDFVFFVRIAQAGLGHRGFDSPDLHKPALRFAAFFGQSDDFWRGLQSECDFRALAREKKELVKNIKPARELASA